MSASIELYSNTLWFIMCMIGLGAALTFIVFHWHKFDGWDYRKGEPADPERIARDNPPDLVDEWHTSHLAKH